MIPVTNSEAILYLERRAIHGDAYDKMILKHCIKVLKAESDQATRCRECEYKIGRKGPRRAGNG